TYSKTGDNACNPRPDGALARNLHQGGPAATLGAMASAQGRAPVKRAPLRRRRHWWRDRHRHGWTAECSRSPDGRRASLFFSHPSKGAQTMSTITTKDGVEIFYKDWGSGQAVVLHHGWPLSSDDWDAQLLYLVEQGYRVVAHDRRGYGRSSQVSDGHDMDHYAADVAAVVEHLNLRDAIHIGHSTGGGETTRYVARYGKGRVAKLVLIGAVPPIMVQTPANPG